MFPRSVVPAGMTLQEFGARLWGRGEEGALLRLKNITRDELLQLEMTCEKAEILRDFYLQAATREEGLPTSPIRVKLMEKCVELLRSP